MRNKIAMMKIRIGVKKIDINGWLMMVKLRKSNEELGFLLDKS